jgi:hypothetical protein
MRAISTFAIAAGLLGCLSAGTLESQSAKTATREEVPPAVFVRIDGRRAAGSGELRVSPDQASLKVTADRKTPALVFVSDKRQRVELRGSGALAGAAGLVQRLGGAQPALLRLQYEQRIEPDARRVFVALLPLSEREPALLVHLDLGGNEPIRKEILPGLILSQRDEPGNKPDVDGSAARRTWLSVEVKGSEPAMTLEGGDTRTLSYRGASYRLHVYRSLRRDPGNDPKLPFEGERYLLTATLTPE